MFFRTEYGDSKLEYPLFGDEAAEEFDGFDIQSPQDAGWASYSPELCNYLRDTWSRDTMGALGQLTTRSRWTHVFINGIYWGIYQIEERPEASFAATYLGGTKEDYDVIKATGLADGYTIEATDGYLTGPVPQTSAWESFFTQSRSHFAAPSEAKYFALQGLGTDGTTANGQPRLLEPDNFIDYLLMVMHSANTDMLSSYWVGYHPNNFYCLRRRGGTRGFICVAHDGETSLDFYADNYDRTGPAGDPSLRANFDYSNPEFFHNDLTPSLEYRTHFGDRAHRALFNGGALTPEKSRARLDKSAAELEPGIIAESARWGDCLRPAQPYTKADWSSMRDATRSWFSSRREHLIAQLRADGLYPAETAPAFSQHGGELPPFHLLTMSGASAPVLYTIDGSDPLATGGAVRAGALSYSGGTSNNVTLIAQGAVWKYRDNGSDQGTAWSQPGFNDSAWASGPAQLGYGEGDEATRVEDNPTAGYNSADTNRYITTYFRRTFTVTGASTFSALTLEILRDDGAIVHLNGTPLPPSNLPAGAVYNTPATTSISGSAENTFISFPFDPALLLEGTNTIAVEIHQNAADSSDVSFDLRLTGTQTVGAQAITLPPGLVRLNARARTAAGAWSALTSADFLVGAEYAKTANLVIAEIMYHPVNGDAEFIEILNRGTKPVDLRGVRLAGGVRFAFPETQPLLAPGARVVVVRNATAFSTVYSGAAFAGQYAGNLDNGGEPLRLISPEGTVLHEVGYDDVIPWPEGADGTNRSIVLLNASSSPGIATNWRASVGSATPGSSDGIAFAAWKTANGITSDTGDDDRDGLSNFAEYFFGTPPHSPNLQPVSLVLEPAGTVLFTARTALAADEAVLAPETSTNLASWTPASATIPNVTLNGDGTITRTWRLAAPPGATRYFVRLRGVLTPQ